MSVITSVWSSFGHIFVSDGGDGSTDQCLTCGAVYCLSPDPEYDPEDGHGYYHANNGDEPYECSRRTDRVHGYERHCENDNGRPCNEYGEPCEHTEHDCNCVLCD